MIMAGAGERRGEERVHAGRADRPECVGHSEGERDIRMAKVTQKISCCFRSPEQASALCRISSYLEAMGHNPVTAKNFALLGKAAESA